MSLPDGGPARTPTTGRPGPHCAERRFASASATECARLRTDLQNAVRRRRPLTPALMKKSSAIATRRRRRRQPVKRGAYGGGALAAMRAASRFIHTGPPVTRAWTAARRHASGREARQSRPGLGPSWMARNDDGSPDDSISSSKAGSIRISKAAGPRRAFNGFQVTCTFAIVSVWSLVVRTICSESCYDMDALPHICFHSGTFFQ